MTVIITMAGLGSRFTSEGFEIPKYKITARGRTLFEWSLLSLTDFHSEKFIFCTLKNDDSSWILKTARRIGISAAEIFVLPNLTRGQAETAYESLCQVKAGSKIWIFNIDTYVVKGLKRNTLDNADGSLEVFLSDDKGMSYVRKNGNDQVLQVAEKKLISNLASLGLYGFSSKELYVKAYLETYETTDRLDTSGERYIAPIYNYLLDHGLRVIAPEIAFDDVHILGTPKQVRQFDSDVMPPYGNLKNVIVN
jgi:NDP-sugar pyrophosphorylase family protein